MPSKRLLKAIMPLLCLVYSLQAYSQAKQISGNVKDSKGAGVVGASVVVKGSRTGTTTNSEGAFTITVPQAATTLVITGVGYNALEVDISSQTTVEATLTESTNSL